MPKARQQTSISRGHKALPKVTMKYLSYESLLQGHENILSLNTSVGHKSLEYLSQGKLLLHRDPYYFIESFITAKREC